MWYHFLLVVGAVQLCISSRFDHLSRPEGCDLNFEGFEPYHDSCMRLWMHRFSLPSSPLVPFLTRAPSLGQVWVLRVLRWVGSRLVGCVRRFRPAPPPLVCVWPVVRPLFFSLALSGFAHSGLGVLVLVFPPFPFLFCVPRLVSRLRSCHLIFIVILFPCPFHLHLHLICRCLKKPRCCGACV